MRAFVTTLKILGQTFYLICSFITVLLFVLLQIDDLPSLAVAAFPHPQPPLSPLPLPPPPPPS